MPSARDADRRYIEAALPEMQDYLLSDELYWPLGGIQASQMRLTIGGLLLALRRTEARDAAGAAALGSQVEVLRHRWRAAWEAKARREAQSRLEQWTHFLDDVRQAREANAQDYRGQVRVRVMLALLLADLPPLPAVSASLEGLDRLMRAGFVPGEFLWEQALRSAFPQDPFWYLYGRLRD